MPDDFEDPIDKIIREAREKGAFQDLPGKGKPLRWDDDSFVPEDQRLAQRLLRDNGFTLDWIALGQEIEAQYSELCRNLAAQRAAHAAGASWQQAGASWQQADAGWERARAEFSRQVQALNRRIIEYNVRVPHEQFTRRPYPTDPDKASGEPPAK